MTSETAAVMTRHRYSMFLHAATLTFCLFLSMTRPGPAHGDDPVRIAVIFAKTGIAKAMHAISYEGASFAVDEVNEKGGVLGHQIEMVELDNKSTPIGSKQAAEEAVRRDVCCVIGAFWSSHSLAVAPILQKAGVPMIAPMSTHPDITRVGDYIFRTCFTDALQGNVMARFARKDLGAEKAAVLINVSSHYSIGLAQHFIAGFTDAGGAVAWTGKYKEKTIDFSEMLRQLIRVRPDATFLPGYGRDSGLIIKQAANMNAGLTFLGGDGWGADIHNIAGNAINGSYFCGHWHPDAPFEESRRMIRNYRQKRGKEIKDNAFVPAYDAVMVLADAIARAGAWERKKLRDALAATRNFRGASGIITFDARGDPANKQAVILKYENGQQTFVKIYNPSPGKAP